MKSNLKILVAILLMSVGLTASEPATGISIMLGRPTDRSITANVQADQTADGYIEYGFAPGVYSFQTSPVRLAAD